MGFTLLELLLALAVGVLAVGLLVVVLRSALDLWARSAGRLAALARARVILDLVERDLQAVLIGDDGQVWLAATVLPDTGLSGWWETAARPKPVGAESHQFASEDIARHRFGVAGVWLRLFTVTSADGDGAIRAVSYQLIRRELAPGTGEAAYLLHRAEVSASRTWLAGYDLDPAAGGYRRPSGTPGDPGNLLRPPAAAVVGDHVVDFGVRLYRREHDGWRCVFPSAGQPGYLARSAADAPHVIEVMVRVLEEEDWRRLAAYESGAGAAGAGWWALAERHSQVAVRRVTLPGAVP